MSLSITDTLLIIATTTGFFLYFTQRRHFLRRILLLNYEARFAYAAKIEAESKLAAYQTQIKELQAQIERYSVGEEEREYRPDGSYVVVPSTGATDAITLTSTNPIGTGAEINLIHNLGAIKGTDGLEPSSTCTWTCFHCGFSTTSFSTAAAHFGDRDDPDATKPLCLWWQRELKNSSLEVLQDTIEQLNAERDECGRLQAKIDGLEYQLDSVHAAIRSYFPGCTYISDAGNLYHSMEGRALAAEQMLDALEGTRMDIWYWGGKTPWEFAESIFGLLPVQFESLRAAALALIERNGKQNEKANE